MIISQTAEYALRAVVLLARANGAALTTPELARTSKIPAHYLAKILQELRRAGIVTSQRGLKGGFVLARPPADVRVLEVVNALDPIERIRTCPLKIKAHGTQLCALHRKLDDAIAAVEKAFSDSTLADLTTSASPPLGTCDQLCLRPSTTRAK